MICKRCKKEIPDESVYCMWCGKKQVSTTRKTLKRENGAGSVYKRSDRKSRPWVAVITNKYGKRESLGTFATAQEAKDALDQYRMNPTNKLNITLKALYEEWKPIGYKDKSKQLIEGYNAAWGKLKPLYNAKFRELRTADMQAIIDELQTERKGKDRYGNDKILKPLSYSSLSKIKILLGLLHKYAMQNDIVNKNYAEFLVLPKKPSGVKDAFTDIELKKIEDAVGIVPFADCILFMCYTGLRITEFLSLNKFSVHEKNGVCALYGGIKTDAGKNKVVPVHHKIKPILDKWLAKNGETIFCRPDGRPYTSRNFREYCFKPALKQIGVRVLNPHATRRTFATLMSKSNVREEDFIAMMGHTEYSVDVEHYIYQSAEKLQKSIELIP
jgi:integrase/recombinase XerD